MCVCVCMCPYAHVSLMPRDQETSCRNWVSPPTCVGPGDQTHGVRLGGRSLCPLNHDSSHCCLFVVIITYTMVV